MSAMNGTRTRVWWLIRLELAFGIALTVLVGRLALGMSLAFRGGNPSAVRMGIPLSALAAMAAVAIAVAGLIWMVRIIRGPREDPPPRWRYRDRPQYHRRADG